MVSKFGNYGVGAEQAPMAIEKLMNENGLTAAGPVYEIYVNVPITWVQLLPERLETIKIYEDSGAKISFAPLVAIWQKKSWC